MQPLSTVWLVSLSPAEVGNLRSSSSPRRLQSRQAQMRSFRWWLHSRPIKTRNRNNNASRPSRPASANSCYLSCRWLRCAHLCRLRRPRRLRRHHRRNHLRPPPGRPQDNQSDRSSHNNNHHSHRYLSPIRRPTTDRAIKSSPSTLSRPQW